MNSRNPRVGGKQLQVAPEETSVRLRRRNAVKQRRQRNLREAAGQEQENQDSP